MGGQTYTYDNNGNLLSDGVSAYTYDTANRLTSVSQGGASYAFAYNGLGDRLQQTVGAVTTSYTLDLAAQYTQVLSDGTNSYLYGIGRIGEDAGTWAYHLPDALGSVRQLTDSSGSLTRAQSFEPFGDVHASAGTAVTNYGFTGEWADATGLVNLRARYLNTGVGRFISRDTWEGDYNRPLSLNKWAYVEGNPINFADPSGRTPLALDDVPLNDGGFSNSFEIVVSDSGLIICEWYIGSTSTGGAATRNKRLYNKNSQQGPIDQYTQYLLGKLQSEFGVKLTLDSFAPPSRSWNYWDANQVLQAVRAIDRMLRSTGGYGGNFVSAYFSLAQNIEMRKTNGSAAGETLQQHGGNLITIGRNVQIGTGGQKGITSGFVVHELGHSLTWKHPDIFQKFNEHATTAWYQRPLGFKDHEGGVYRYWFADPNGVGYDSGIEIVPDLLVAFVMGWWQDSTSPQEIELVKNRRDFMIDVFGSDYNP